LLEIRPFQKSDEAAMRRICLLTGENGGDATALYADTELLSDIYAIPYTVLDPELCFVAVDGESDRVVGYIVGTADSARFAQRFKDEWLPRVSGRHQAPPEESDRGKDAQAAMAWNLHHPWTDPRLAEDYPAHLHIDLLPEAQGKGGGRALMETYLNAARKHGARGVHLYVSRRNTNAQAFYVRLGFEPIVLPGNENYGGSLLVGRSTTTDA
jgi:ribosomal protein S18 acetylase RimI-like enzyme